MFFRRYGADGRGRLPYFIGRRDEMIKTSAIRVVRTKSRRSSIAPVAWPNASPSASTSVLGQAIVVVTTLSDCQELDALRCSRPAAIGCRSIWVRTIDVKHNPCASNPNGKIDRQAAGREFADLFQAVR